MNSYLLTQHLEQINHQENLNQLEVGKVLFFPECYFSNIYCSRSKPQLMCESILHGTHKNVSYDYKRNQLGAYKKDVPGLGSKLEHLMRGYAEFAHQLIQAALPSYVPYLQWGRTSFRPAQISGRMTSKRKDD